MRITIDATSALLRSAGVKNYVYHWVRHLRLAAGCGDEIRGYPFLNELGRLDHDASTLSKWQTMPRLAALYLTRASFALDWAIAGSDVFHASNQVRRAPRRARLTATIYDLTTRLMPQFHTAGNIRAERTFTENILTRAAGMIAISENTRQDAIRLLGLEPEKITTIYPGISEQYFGARPKPRERPYLLYVGTIEPRKNLETLLDAWRLVKPSIRGECDLVIAGPGGWAPTSTLARVKAETKYLGYVREEELPGLIAGAAAFVYPSLYEGFGFPPAQAMAAGTPVITSNNSCLPEVAGGAALLTDARSPAEIAAAITRVVESDSLRARLSELGRARAESFRWENCAAQSLQFFRRLS
ncbi:MAG TPA: glycosyltransferase family 1 protein [Bryobacteraceae bacterium]|jgi:glycosyltransferase involved in cell wall biosynthesis|nr:glycosyltransferase family 1 protein [Bryobacteraceae bacterium]